MYANVIAGLEPPVPSSAPSLTALPTYSLNAESSVACLGYLAMVKVGRVPMPSMVSGGWV